MKMLFFMSGTPAAFYAREKGNILTVQAQVCNNIYTQIKTRRRLQQKEVIEI
jgi:hypothetical protein